MPLSFVEIQLEPNIDNKQTYRETDVSKNDPLKRSCRDNKLIGLTLLAKKQHSHGRVYL